MATKSMIEWTESTWNPVTGCTKVSSGCDNCYAERFSERFRGVVGHPFEVGFDLTLRPERIEQPKSWRRPRLIFVNSMSDLFHKDIPREYIDKVFDTMEAANWHTYQVLTKRSSLMRTFINSRYRESPAPAHIWLGVSVENSSALSRVDHLRQSNARVRFVSFEPLLGPVCGADLSNIDWVIAGGESGPRARPVDKEWLRMLRDQCIQKGVAFFFKQWGGRTPKSMGNTLDGRQWMQYPICDHNSSRSALGDVAGTPKQLEVFEVMEVGPWAKEKLECLRKYLHAYTTILRRAIPKSKSLTRFFYVDAFAGPGLLKIRKHKTSSSEQDWLINLSEYAGNVSSEVQAYISGSPKIALELQHPFTDYVFIETDDARIQELEALKESYEKCNANIYIRQRNCAEYLREWLERCEGHWSKWRGIIFLDPFGMQVSWDLISLIGKTKAIEVVINFPVGMAIQRSLKNRGIFTNRERLKLDEYFGTEEWFPLLYRKNESLFGDSYSKVSEAGDTLVKWYCERLKEQFGYVAPPREIQTPDGHPLYYLIWAGPNETGAKIASHVLQQGARDLQLGLFT